MNDNLILSAKQRALRDALTAIRTGPTFTNFAPSDELLDINEVAHRLGLPKSTIYELTRNRAHVRHSHPLPSFKVGRRLKFNWSSVVRWLDTLEKEAA